jgi:hypothetical protein
MRIWQSETFTWAGTLGDWFFFDRSPRAIVRGFARTLAIGHDADRLRYLRHNTGGLLPAELSEPICYHTFRATDIAALPQTSWHACMHKASTHMNLR